MSKNRILSIIRISLCAAAIIVIILTNRGIIKNNIGVTISFCLIGGAYVWEGISNIKDKKLPKLISMILFGSILIIYGIFLLF